MTGSNQPDPPGIEQALRALTEGYPVVVPNPSPMTYGVVATTPQAVNTLKGRPLDQNVAISLHDDGEWQRISTGFDLPPPLLPWIVDLLRERLSLLVPLRRAARHPDWILPAVRGDYLAMFDGYWAPLARLWDRFPRLYGSSANRTGQPPAASAGEAIRNLGRGAVVVDGDALRDPGCTHAGSSMLRIARDGTLSLHRRGAQDAATGLDTEAYLQRLASDDRGGRCGSTERSGTTALRRNS